MDSSPPLRNCRLGVATPGPTAARIDTLVYLAPIEPRASTQKTNGCALAGTTPALTEAAWGAGRRARNPSRRRGPKEPRSGLAGIDAGAKVRGRKAGVGGGSVPRHGTEDETGPTS
jgi:hypothetical protein